MSKLIVNAIRHTGASSDAVTLASDGTCTANITNNLSNRNLIINGAAQINQRGNQTGISSGGTNYTLDRWSLSLVNGGTWNISQSTDTPDGFGNSIKLECTTADTSLGASDYLLLRQKIEGQNVQAFAKGTSSAKQFAVSFYLKTNKTGVYTIELRDNNNSRTCGKTITVSNSNWNRYTLIFPADTTGVFDNNNADSLQLNIWLAAGSDRTSGTLQTAWGSQTNANRVLSSNVNLADNTSNEFYLTGVQLEVGSVATDFEHRSFGQELALARRYYFGNVGNGLFGVGRTTNASTMWSIQFPTEMRVNPSMSLTSTTVTISEPNAANFDVTSATLADAHGGTTSKAFYLNGTMSVSPGDNLFLTTNYLKFDAEL